ncbi:MAG: NADH-quinone oxidoreductase subunit NuoK [Deltaproteobacteria bacterium]|nr:NADH-quinone oxidoreductase subunit NuoK [Deltaproteobacteria bacterium]
MNLSSETIIVATAVFIFSCGAAGVVLRKNPIGLLMSVELMINAAIMVMVLGSRLHAQPTGQSVALLVLVLGAAEAVVGLALALAVFRRREHVDVDEAREIQG